MPRKERAVQATASGNHEALKPEPPSDLWEQLARLENRVVERPADSFTAAEYARRFGMGASGARDRIARLIQKGQARCIGQQANCKFYVLVRP